MGHSELSASAAMLLVLVVVGIVVLATMLVLLLRRGAPVRRAHIGTDAVRILSGPAALEEADRGARARDDTVRY